MVSRVAACGARGAPDDVEAIRLEIESALNAQDDLGRRVGNARHGVYAFFDFDGEPITSGRPRSRSARACGVI